MIHFYLYAKNWYERGDQMEDLLKIHHFHMNHDIGTERDALCCLRTAAVRQLLAMNNAEYYLNEFLSKLRGKDIFGKPRGLTHDELLIEGYLYVLGQSTIDDMAAAGIKVEDANPKCLPLRINKMTESLKQVIMRRDGLSAEEADAMIADARSQVFEEGCNPEEVLSDEFGLEPDYVFDLLM